MPSDFTFCDPFSFVMISSWAAAMARIEGEGTEGQTETGTANGTTGIRHAQRGAPEQRCDAGYGAGLRTRLQQRAAGQ
jgi:hypothetical protein